MDRRGFLKLLSASAVTIALPVPEFVLTEPEIVIPQRPYTLGAIRTLCAYELYRDEYMIRMDACNGRDQFAIDMRLLFPAGATIPQIRAHYLQQRAVAEQVLFETLKHEKWVASDLIALPTPHGYIEPPWMRPDAA